MANSEYAPLTAVGRSTYQVAEDVRAVGRSTYQVAEDVRQLTEQLMAIRLVSESTLQNYVITVADNLNSLYCCGLRWRDADVLFIHFVVKHAGGVENARRLLATYPEQKEPYPVMRRQRRQL